MNESTQLLECVYSAHARLIKTTSEWTAEQAAFNPAAESWSAVQIVEHLYRSEFRITNVLCQSKESWRNSDLSYKQDNPNCGRTLEEIEKPIVADRYRGPSAVDPVAGGLLPFWTDALMSAHILLEKTIAVFDPEDLENGFFTHFLFGKLNAKQCVAFVAFHIERHRRQIEQIASCSNFPATNAIRLSEIPPSAG